MGLKADCCERCLFVRLLEATRRCALKKLWRSLSWIKIKHTSLHQCVALATDADGFLGSVKILDPNQWRQRQLVNCCMTRRNLDYYCSWSSIWMAVTCGRCLLISNECLSKRNVKIIPLWSCGKISWWIAAWHWSHDHIIAKLIARFIIDQHCWTQTSLWSRGKTSWQTLYISDHRMIKLSVTVIKSINFNFKQMLFYQKSYVENLTTN